jgi:DNA invertase Pin-like site-specific DNA recombinase
MRYGYIRVGKQDQNYDLQYDALTSAGCDKIFSEKMTRTNFERPELLKLLSTLTKGDTLIVWKLDRLGGRVKELIRIVNDFNEKGVQFISTTQNIDTNTPIGHFFFQIMASLAEFEVKTIRERTKAGLESARARGRKGGRPKGLSSEARIKAIAVYQLYQSKKFTVSEILKQTGISVGTLYSYVRMIEQEESKAKEKFTINTNG